MTSLHDRPAILATQIDRPGADPWSLALLALYFHRAGEAGRAQALVERLAADTGFAAECLYLWIASETVSNRLDHDRARLEAIVQRIGREYRLARPNWIDTGTPGFYATTLALAWGAVSSFSNATGHAGAAILVPRIKEDFFRGFMTGGSLKSRKGGEQLFSDIVLCSVPFGLMDAGNQIMVESVNAIEQRQFRGGFAFSADTALFGGAPRPDLDCLMAWYFIERGEAGRAKTLLAPWRKTWLEGPTEAWLPEFDAKRALDSESLDIFCRNAANGVPCRPRATILLLLADQRLGMVESSSDSTGPLFLHEPAGNGNRYLVQTQGRIPTLPMDGEPVCLRLVVRPLPFGATLRLHAAAQEKTIVKDLSPVSLDGAEGYHEAILEGLAAGTPVSYHFELAAQDQTWRSATWDFVVGKREDIVTLRFGDAGQTRLTSASGLEFEIQIATDPSSGTRLEALPDGGFRLLRGNQVLASTWAGWGQAPISLDCDATGRPTTLRVRLAASASEEFYGCGERFASIGYRGKRLDSWVFNQYRDQGYRSYIPLPFWQSSAGYGVRILSGAYAETGFCDLIEGMVEIVAELAPNTHSGIQFYAGRPWDIVRAYHQDTGAPALPPRWAFGPWMSSNNWDNQALSLEQARITRELDIPATVFVLEQWSDEATFYIFNDALYDRKSGGDRFNLADFRFPAEGRWPDPKAMVDSLHADGLKVLLWQVAAEKYMDGLPHAQRDADEAFMIEKGYCLRHKDGRPYRIPDFEWFKRSLAPDFSLPEAREWWLSKRRYLVEEIGIDGFKTDGGECVHGADVQDSTGRQGDALRNRYPMEYIGAFHRFVKELKGGDALTFSRAGFEGVQTVPAHWAGDERSTFNAFRASLRAGLSAALSGLPFWGWDLGGFNGEIPDAELFLRSTAMAAFCPIMQYHAETKGEKNRDRTPWNIAERTGNPAVIEVYRHFAWLRMNLLPYLWAEAKHSAASSESLMRPLFAEYPEVPALRHIDDEYLLGRYLLVAPVLNPGQESRRMVFPEGTWVGLLDGQRQTGPGITAVSTPLDTIPVYVRTGRLIPLNLHANGQFPSPVGNQWEDYTNLVLLAVLERELHARYQTYADQEIRVDLELRSGRLTGEVHNGSDKAITLWIDRPDTSQRQRLALPPGKTTWPA